jgi:hypothetical protein
LQSCASVHACPVCAPKIRQERSDVIEAACSAWAAEGRAVGMLTLTVKHAQGDALAELLDGLMSAWGDDLVAGAAWAGRWRVSPPRKWALPSLWSGETKLVPDERKQVLAIHAMARAAGFDVPTPMRTAWFQQGDRQRFHIAGWVRSVEVTWGVANGWHPHIHALVFFDAQRLDVQPNRRYLERELADRWADAVERRGVGRPDLAHGCKLELMDEPAEAARYIAGAAKVDGKLVPGERPWRRAALETGRWDLKSARRHRFQPFDLLDAVEDGEAWAFHRWQEYEAATHGRRAITWSVGMRERCGLDEQERTDEEIAADDVGGEVVGRIPGRLWAKVARTKSGPTRVLDAAEQGGAPAVEAVLVALDRGGG